MSSIELTQATEVVSTKSKAKPRGRYMKREDISSEYLDQMYEIYSEYYANTRKSIFLEDFKKKHGAILILHPKRNEVVGFSTVAIHQFTLNNKNYTFLFSGDTVIQKEFWGCRTLQTTMMKLLIKLRFRFPFDELYWLLISKGYKTYLLLANNYFVYYPHHEGKHAHLKPIVEHYCKTYFNEYFDHDSGLLNFGSDYQPLKADVAPITQQMRQDNPKISFFERENPTWVQGTELPCIGRLAWQDVLRFPLRMLTKPASKGKQSSKSRPSYNTPEGASS